MLPCLLEWVLPLSRSLPAVAMIATGCIMARVCHTNNCPVGVASQREELRARFPGARPLPLPGVRSSRIDAVPGEKAGNF